MATPEERGEFEFDSALTPEANTELFFDYLAEKNPEFATLLRENIGGILSEGSSRQVFSEKIKAALDASSSDGSGEQS